MKFSPAFIALVVCSGIASPEISNAQSEEFRPDQCYIQDNAKFHNSPRAVRTESCSKRNSADQLIGRCRVFLNDGSAESILWEITAVDIGGCGFGLLIPPDDKTILFNSGGLKRIEVTTGKILNNFPGLNVQSGEFSPDSQKIVSTPYERDQILVDFTDDRWTKLDKLGYNNYLWPTFSPDSNWVYLESPGHKPMGYLVNIKTFQSLELDEDISSHATRQFRAYYEFSNDGQYFLSVTKTGIVQVADLMTQQVRMIFNTQGYIDNGVQHWEFMDWKKPARFVGPGTVEVNYLDSAFINGVGHGGEQRQVIIKL